MPLKIIHSYLKYKFKSAVLSSIGGPDGHSVQSQLGARWQFGGGMSESPILCLKTPSIVPAWKADYGHLESRALPHSCLGH